MTSPHTGNLEQDSPSLLSLAKHILDDSQLETLKSAYNKSMSSGGNIEQGLTRKEGASYNPRPARVCEILVKECKEDSVEVLTAALLACAPDISERAQVSGGKDVVIQLAIALDTVRHLHMTELTEAEQMLEINFAIGLLWKAREMEIADRLTDMVELAAKRAKSNL